MPKVDKAIPEEIPIEEAPAVIRELVAAQAEETPEERDERLKREDYIQRDEAAWAERERIYRDNGLLKEGEHLSRDPEAAIRGRCCF